MDERDRLARVFLSNILHTQKIAKQDIFVEHDKVVSKHDKPPRLFSIKYWYCTWYRSWLYTNPNSTREDHLWYLAEGGRRFDTVTPATTWQG